MKKLIFSSLFLLLTLFVYSQDRGECISGNCQDGHGVYKTIYGHTYTGEFKNGKYDGQGYLDMLEGMWYRGSFKNGLKDGYGVLQFGPLSAGFERFEGEWKNGKMNGYGKQTYKCKQSVEGIYVNGVPDGRCINLFQDDHGKNHKTIVTYSKEKSFEHLKEEKIY